MSKNPILNALLAGGYIVLVVTVTNYVGHFTNDNKSPIVGPIAFLSLFTLSVATMGYLFIFQPLQLYLDGQKKQGVNLFLQTLGSFAVLTILVLALLLSGVLR
jgi:hypothetical protein